jgi:DNA replication protein DnaC
MDITMQSITTRMEELGLSFMAAGFDSYLAEASRADKPLKEAVYDLLELEYIPRKERMAKTRLKVSGIPEVKRLEDFDLTWLKGGLTERKFKELSSLSFIRRNENVILMGPSGLGKTHLMLALAHKACMTGFTAYYISCMDLIEGLGRARSTNKLKRKLQWYRKPHVLVIDEAGYENLDKEQANLFFQLVNSRYEHGSIIITTNKAFTYWGEVMSDDAIATATLDRLLHHAHIVSLKGESYRMKDRMKVGAVDLE